MKTEPETFPPESGISSVGSQSISEIILNLRKTFKERDFIDAEKELVSRDEALRREISRLKEENRSAMEDQYLDRLEISELRDELAAAKRSSEGERENLAKPTEEKDLKRKRNSGAKSSPIEPIAILDSDGDRPFASESPEKESSSQWRPKVPKREPHYSPSQKRENECENYPNSRNHSPNRELETPIIIKPPLDSPAKNEKRQFSISDESKSNSKLGPGKRCSRTRYYDLFWSRFGKS